MTSLGFVLRMAAREVRASPRRLLLLTASVAVGVAALVAINSFTANLRDSVRRQAQALLGADLSLESRQPLPASAERLIDTLVARGAAEARVTNFSAMGYVPRTDGTRLVQVAAIQGDYPFYGEIRTDPAPAWSALQAGRHAVADPALLAALQARVGDTLALGEARFVIAGTIASAPGNVGLRAAFGPRVYIPARYLEETRLLGFGARAEYEAYLRLPPSISAQAVAEERGPSLRSDRVRVRTVEDDRERLNETLSRLTGYLGLVALIALLLGGIGVASAVVVFIRQRMDTIAVLRCLGATGRRVLAVYGVEAAGMALTGSALGATAGVLFQQALPGLLADLLPVDVDVSISWAAIAMGVGMGLWVALVFALFPLLGVRRVPPLAALRRDFESEPRPRDPWRWGVAFALAASTVALATVQVGSGRQGAIFAGAVGVALLVLWAASWVLVRGARRWLPGGLPYLWRQGLSNLHRPSNQTVTIVLAIGFGAFLLGTLVLVQLNLLDQLRLTGGPARPNLVLFDIQPDQLPAVERALSEAGLTAAPPVPIVPMRIASVNGRPVQSILADSTTSGTWAFRREYRSTYRDSLVASERLEAGSWWTPGARADRPSGTNGDGVSRISVETGLAEELGVTVGDEVVWDVQGISIPTRVASLREVDWARFEPNFFVVFEPGALEGAPHTLVTLTRIERPSERGAFQRRLAERLPNVTTLDLSVVQEALERLVDRVVLAIRFMAAFTLATGTLVLVGALATSRFQRIREGALLRTLGATRSQIFRIVLAEYLALGAMAATVAAVLSTLAAWALATWVFEGRFALQPLTLAGLTLGVVALTVVVGLLNSREVIRRTPLEVLRGE
ncbi:MAG TPA: FtsX-like permease family protein [Gemmatimonadales bacterium]|nr:FtsX-like permease family protein [Gemmatimonadales bacterium]